MDERQPGEPYDPERLDEISTPWSLMRLAHGGSVTVAGPARDALVLRYNRAIRGYVGALIRDDHDADEVAQDVVVRMLRGDFAQATPQRGRFRDLLKVAVKNMVRSYWRSQRRAAPNIAPGKSPAEPTDAANPIEDVWRSNWRQGLIEMSWRALEVYQLSVRGSIAHTLLRLRADFPDDDTEALASRLCQATGNSYRAAAVRQQLRRARLRFAQLMIEEVARSIDDPTPARVEVELADLELMEYVRDFLPADWRKTGALRELL